MDLPSTLCVAWMTQVFCLVGAWVVFCTCPPATITTYDWYVTLFVWSFKFIVVSVPCVGIAVMLLMRWNAEEIIDTTE